MRLKTFAIIPNTAIDAELSATREVVKFLVNLGAQPIMDERFGGKIPGVEYLEFAETLTRADFCVVIGGDGTILNIASSAAIANLPIIGINYGNMGFLAAAERGEFRVLQDVLEGKYEIDKRMMLDSCVKRGGEIRKKLLTLNDVVVFRGQYSRMINLDVEVDGVLAESYRADGIIISAPTGSTAYSLSAGGAILDPTVDGIIITPICPHTTRARSLVVAGERKVSIQVNYKTKMDATVAVDGNEIHVMEDGDFVEVCKSSYTASLVRPSDRDFFDVLRKKM